MLLGFKNYLVFECGMSVALIKNDDDGDVAKGFCRRWGFVAVGFCLRGFCRREVLSRGVLSGSWLLLVQRALIMQPTHARQSCDH